MQNLTQQGEIQLTSQAFKNGGNIPVQYTSKGENVNPPLNILNTPLKTKSLALILHDPDAIGTDFVHWLVWDISPKTKAIAANSVPPGAVQGLNSAGANSYIGPCPPKGSGSHHYAFELYALDHMLNLKNGTSREELEEALKGHIIDYYKLTGLVSA